MTKLQQFADFTDQNIFVGIDVHKNSWNVTLYSDKNYLRTFSQPPSVESLRKLLHRDYPGATFLCGYESGFSGFWIQRSFQQMGINCQVFHAADIPHTQKHKTTKTDAIDSRALAQALSVGTISPIYIPDPEIESLRSLVRFRSRLQRDIQRCKNRIRSLLFQFGYQVPDCYTNNWSNRFVQWLKTFEIEHQVNRTTLNHMIEHLELLRNRFLTVNKDIRSLYQKERCATIMKSLLSVPGIGPITAITLITEIADIHRFKTFKQLNSFVGLYPMEHSSGEHEHFGSITIRNNKYLRKLLTEAAWIAIRHDPALLLVFNDWSKRMTKKRAIIKIARKLLTRIRYVWINETLYVKGLIK